MSVPQKSLLSSLEVLLKRAAIVRAIREFFWVKGYIECETPYVTAHPGQEPYIDPLQLRSQHEAGKALYLHTSPEYAMKKGLAAGFSAVFQLSKTFRDEPASSTHRREFTMLEWYHKDYSLDQLMDETEELVSYLFAEYAHPLRTLPPFKRVRVETLFQEHFGASLLDNLQSVTQMKQIAKGKGLTLDESTSWTAEDIFFKLFLQFIEPNLGKQAPLFLTHYPASMAALARLSPDDPRVAERFELYLDGLELANAFCELTDPHEQRKRFEGEQAERKALGKTVFPIDEQLLKVLPQLGPCSGIALGVDRLLMCLLNENEIGRVQGESIYGARAD